MRTVLILGAGATMADATRLPEVRRPPLDPGFFRKAGKAHPKDTQKLLRYFEKHYARNIQGPLDDSLEQIMAALYADVYNPSLSSEAYECFLALVGVFSRLLAETTNALRPSQGSLLYRVITSYLRTEISPDELTIITFNQDIQIEQALVEASQKKRYQSLGRIFNFPGSYRLGDPHLRLSTTPQVPLFDVERDEHSGVEVLKLHGSLNWYSKHVSTNPSITALFNRSRKIQATRRRVLDPDMGIRGGQRRLYTFPLIVPPVTHKSGILHDKLRPLWTLAEKRIRQASHVAVFGYSCPAADFESAGMISRAIHANKLCKAITIIDPDSGLVDRYIGLTGLRRVHYYKFATDFLSAARTGIVA